jgi:hypothetical protein
MLLVAGAMGCAIVGGATAARGATISTTDGSNYTGAITIVKGDSVTINDAKAGMQTVPLANIADLAMDAPVPPPDPLIAQYLAREAPNLPALLPPAAPPATMPSTAPVTLDNGWQQADIGEVAFPGDGSVNGGTITASGSGWGFWGPEDSGHLVYRNFSGDFDCIVHIAQLPADTAPFLVGLVVRSNLNPDCPMAALTARATDPPHITNRPIALHDTHAAAAGAKPYDWLRIVRCHDGVSGFCSSDGVTWISAGWVQVDMGRDVLVGVGCSAIANQQVVSTTFDHFSIRAGMLGPSTGIGLIDGTRLPVILYDFDGKTLVYGYPQQPQKNLPANQLAEIFSQPLPAPGDDALSAGKTGIWLNSGDFVDTSGSGSAVTFANGAVTATSVLLGQQQIPNYQFALALISPPTPKDPIRVSTREGDLYYCSAISSDDGKLILTTSLGKISVAASDLMEIKTAADAFFEQK